MIAVFTIGINQSKISSKSEPLRLKVVLVGEGRHGNDLVFLPSLDEEAFGGAGGLHLDLALLYLSQHALIAVTFILRCILLGRN